MALPATVGGNITAADINTLSAFPVANFAALPTGGNFVGKLIAALDTGTTFRWDGSAWLYAGDRTLGTAYRTTGLLVTGANTWTTVAEFTGDGLGRPVRVQWTSAHMNPGSGQPRVLRYRLVVDGVMFGIVTDYDVPIIAGTNGYAGAGMAQSTPAPGTRTWALQVFNVTANSVTVMSASMLVTAM